MQKIEAEDFELHLSTSSWGRMPMCLSLPCQQQPTIYIVSTCSFVVDQSPYDVDMQQDISRWTGAYIAHCQKALIKKEEDSKEGEQNPEASEPDSNFCNKSSRLRQAPELVCLLSVASQQLFLLRLSLNSILIVGLIRPCKSRRVPSRHQACLEPV